MRLQRSTATVLAVAILLAFAVLLGGMGLLLLTEIPVRGHAPGASGGVFEAILGLGVGLLLAAVVHLVAATRTWRGLSLTLARAVSWAGLVLGTVAFVLSLIGAADVAVLVLLVPLAYGVVLVGLRSIAGARQ